MNIKIEPISLEQKSAFIQLFNLYSYDFTEYTNVDIGEDGYLNNDYANKSWINEELHHFFIRVNEKIAGFMIIGNGSYLYLEDNNAHHIDEFFIMKKYRRMGVGRYATKAAFDMFKGKWEVCQMQNNLPARKFWKSVISEYTNDNYQECGTEKDDMVGFIFDNSPCKVC